MFDLPGRFKWDAWTKLGDLPAEDAKKLYVQTVLDIVEKTPKERSSDPEIQRLIDEQLDTLAFLYVPPSNDPRLLLPAGCNALVLHLMLSKD
jgi:hypothetical protein